MMSDYLPIIISAVLIIATLLWWLLALDGVKKTDSAPKDIVSPKVTQPDVPAPPIVPVTKKAVPPKLMDDPTPPTKTAKAKAQAPLKAAATKKAPAVKAAAPDVAVPKTTSAKVAKPKAAAQPLALKAKAEAAPKAKAVKPAVTVAIPDNLELIKGLGPKVNNMLKGMGITSFAQVANWTADDVAEIDGKLGAFAGRITRDNWIDQAQLLLAGDAAAFEKKYGALGSDVKG
jgi:predicted flap endonuclease-1-like 5' DNA nuclease